MLKPIKLDPLTIWNVFFYFLGNYLRLSTFDKKVSNAMGDMSAMVRGTGTLLKARINEFFQADEKMDSLI